MDTPRVWDAIHSAAGGRVSNWYFESSEGVRFVRAALACHAATVPAGAPLPDGAACLHIGAGLSDLGDALAGELGWAVTNIDFSEESVAAQRERVPHATYLHADAARLEGWTQPTFHVVLDKGTLDAVCQCVTPQTADTARRIVREALRVLLPGGVFIIFSIIDAAVRAPLLLEAAGLDATTGVHSVDPSGAPFAVYSAPRGPLSCRVWRLAAHPLEMPDQEFITMYAFSKLAAD